MIRCCAIIMTVLTTLFCLCGSIAEASSIIQKINRADETSRIQIFIKFSTLPLYEFNTIGRKVNLILYDSVQDDGLTFFPEDNRIIKTLAKTDKNNTAISFYFRYNPQQVTITDNEDTATLMVDILLGNPFSALYPDLSTKLQGVTILDRNNIDATNPWNLSVYRRDWKSFFSRYESDVKITPALRLTLPPFPLAAALRQDIDEESWLSALLPLSQSGKWNQILQQLREQSQTVSDEYIRALMLLTYGETLVRAGNYKQSYPILHQVITLQEDSEAANLAELLLLYQHGMKDGDNLIYYDLKENLKKLDHIYQFSAYFNILLAESALVANRVVEAEKILQRDDVAYKNQALPIRLLRQADIRYRKNEKIKALVSYLQLAEHPELIDSHPMSLANFSNLLYENNRIQEAETRYNRLTDMLNGTSQQNLALFRLAMVKSKTDTSARKTKSALFQIIDAFPQSEGAFRSHLKLTDFGFLAGKISTDKAAVTYNKLAQDAPAIILRAEATFKKALLHALSGERFTAITQLMQMLRDFQSGSLRIEAKALIIDLLPLVLKELIDKDEYIEALVLAKKNRGLFARGWVSTDLLKKLATAYSNLGFYDRAVRTYLYIFEVTEPSQQIDLYAPLLEAFYQDGQYDQVADYADRFIFRYPENAQDIDIYYLRLRALVEKGDRERAALFLDKADSPKSKKIASLAANTYFTLDRWQDVITVLTQPDSKSLLKTPDTLFILAESYFQNGEVILAAPLFKQINKAMPDDDQIKFRLAQIDLMNDNTSQALKRFKEIAEKGKAPLWVRLAREEAAILQMGQTP